MRKKQIVVYISLFVAAVLALLGIAYGIRMAIRAGNLAGIDWYNLRDKEFVISTEKELYEFATLSDYYDFEGQTIKLGADIVVNEGKAEDWHENAPAKKWQPITEFAGTFDGQGHSISGLYGKSSSMSMGLFSETKKGCVLQDFKLLNSYFSNTTNNGLGSIMGEGTGEIKKVYTDAIIYGYGESNGGIAGLIKEELLIQECWFDGKVIGEQRSNGGMIGWVDRKSDVTIDNCLNSGLIQFVGEGNSKTGGFVGGISDIAYRTDVSMVEITNSLTTGKIDVTNTTMAGVAVGTVRQIGALTFNNTYAAVEVTDNAVTETTIGSVSGKLTGNVVARYRENLIGVGGYQWTNLDFEKYWSCVEGDTPVLKYFSESSLALKDVEKEIDTSWYKQGQTEFVLKDAADLWGFAMLSANTNFEGVTIKLGNDIVINDSDCSTWKEKAPKYNWFPIYSFSGIFDGQGHSISGLYSYSNGKRIALFQQVNSNGSISNFSLLNSYIRGSYCIGSVAAQGGGNISNIYTDAIVENTGEHTGGILGALNQNGTISNCWFDGEVYGGTSYTGGITSAAMAAMSNVTHCLNTGTVYGGTTHSTGGLVGIVNNHLALSDSLNVGKVDDSLSANKNRTGSVIGRIFDDTETTKMTVYITNTYATKESYETTLGQGYTVTGAAFVNTLAELKGNNAYKNTLLNFQKFWAIDKDGHPILQTFAEEIPELPNTTRPIVADIDWFDEDENVFVIKTAEQLYGFAQLAGRNDFEGKTVKLGANIKVNAGSASSWGKKAPQNQWASIQNFNGTFDGCGYTISGLYINDGLWKVGLFGNVSEKAVIKNVKVTNSYFESRYHVGAIAGMITNAKVQNVYSNANIVVRKGHGGGLVGSMAVSTIDNAWFAGTVTSESDYIGGITSFITTATEEQKGTSTLSNCLNTGTIKGKSNVGGLVGRVANKGVIKYSFNAGTVTGVKNAGSIVGVVVKDDKSSLNMAEGVYATAESAKKTVGSGTARGVAVTLPKEEFAGNKAYQRTILDFSKYWAVVSESTPVLKRFGGSAPTTAGVARATKPDTSWYKASKKTFVLNDYADLYGFAVLAGSTDFAGKTIKLGKDIVANSGDAADFKENIPLNQLIPVSGFAGTFDGQGHTISGLAANSENAWYVGLIGTTEKGATIKNVNIENSYLTGEYHIGSVAGQVTDTKIENVYSNAIMEATSGHLGGIVGSVTGDKNSISNCWFDGSVTAKENYAGGITSFAVSGSVVISHCLNTAPIEAKSQVAGLVGRVADDVKLTVNDSLTTGTITGSSAAGTIVGKVMEKATVKFEAVYGLKENSGKIVGNGTTYSGDAQVLNQVYMQEESGYVYTNLDFSKYWVAVEDSEPQLKYFADKLTGDVLNLKNIDRMDTSWYDSKKDTFVLKNRADLFGFAYLLNGENTFKGKTVVLEKDIEVNEDGIENPVYQWMPIGSYQGHTSYNRSFKGTFDGQMHTISGLYTKQTGDANAMYNWCAGLFGRTADGAVIKNVKVVDSYFESPYYSGIVGHATDTIIDTVYTDATIVVTSGNGGGIAGAATETTINNVWFGGSVENAGQFTGGIVGLSLDGVMISNALTTGTVKTTTASGNSYIGGIVGGANGETVVTDSLSVPKTITASTKNCVGSVIGGVNKDTKATATNTYALEATSNLTIGQQVKAEEIGEAVNRIKVYADLKGMNGYTLTKLDFAYYWVALKSKTPELMSFSDGTALNVDTAFRADTEWYKEAEGTKEDPYVICSKAELYGFAELVNEGVTFEGKYVELGATIPVNSGKASDWAKEAPDYAWTPIGSYVAHTDFTKSFAGHFDGKGYTISGLYTKKTGDANNVNNWGAGLFGRTNGATVQNVRVENSYFEAPYYGGVIGDTKDTTIKNIYTDAIVKTTSGNGGGITGRLDGGSAESVWFDGTITNAGQYTGGIVGVATNGASIENALTTGTVTSTSTASNAYAGGLVGGATANITLTNSISAAKSVSASGKRAGAAIGSASAAGVTVTMDNVYVIAGAHKFAVGEGAVGTYTKQPWVMPTLDGYNGYTLTKLDFADAWVAVEGQVPEIKTLSKKTALNVADSFRPDTTFAGSGTASDPYVIATTAELYGLAQLVNEGTTFEGQYIVLGADIEVNTGDYTKWGTKAPTYAWTPIGYYNVRTKEAQHFKGTFNGQMHKISGIYMSATKDDVNIGGLFVDTDACTIKNLKLVDSYIEASEGTAAIAGWNNGGTFDTIYTNAIVKSHKNNAAGLVGLINEADSKITNCWFDGELTGKKYVGGLVAYATSGENLEISHCLNTGTVTSTHMEDKDGTRTYAGGLVGDANTNITITDCLVACKEPIQTTDGMSYMGSVAGRVGSSYTATNVYALSSVCEYTSNSGVIPGTTRVADATGNLGYFNTGLDFYNYWVVTKDTVPQLKSFATSSETMDVSAWFENATGTETDPYVINEAIELYDFAKRMNAGNDFAGKYIVLGKDIEVNKGNAKEWGTNPPTISWTPIGTSTIAGFKGHFNATGEMREISGLYIDQGTKNFAGLFGSVIGGSVKNLKITNSYVKGGSFVAAFAGFTNNTTIENVYTNATVVGASTAGTVQVGSIIGYQVKGTVRNAWFDGVVTGVNSSQYVGGIVGRTNDGDGAVIENCLATGTVTSGRTSGNAYAGGILGGTTRNTTVSNCFVALKSSLTTAGATACVGSIAGGSGSANYTLTVKNCYAASGVYSTTYGAEGAGKESVTATVLDAYTGADGYKNTTLVFDRPETTDVVEGPWVARTGACPGLAIFTDAKDMCSLDGIFVADTTWSSSPVKETIDGVEVNTYTIDRPEELIGLANLVNAGTKNFAGEVIYLENDLVFNTGKASDWKTTAPTYKWSPIGTTAQTFKGTFKSRDEIHTISGLYSVTSKDANTNRYIGLFGHVDGATIANLRVTNSYFAGNDYVGVVGFVKTGEIDTIYSDSIVNINKNGGSAGGGIVGYISGGNVKRCWFDGTIDSIGRYLGGVVGIEAGAETISDCLMTGTIKTTCTSGNIYTGGLVGLVRTDVRITNCLVAAREMQTSKTGCYGSVIGSINDSDKTAAPYVATVEKVYALDNIGNTTVTVGRTSYQGGSMSGAPVEKMVQELQTGYATLLNADNWTLDTEESQTPILKNFAK